MDMPVPQMQEWIEPAPNKQNCSRRRSDLHTLFWVGQSTATIIDTFAFVAPIALMLKSCYLHYCCLCLQVITSAEFHPQQCNVFAYSSSKGCIRLADMRNSALCDKHAKAFEELDMSVSSA